MKLNELTKNHVSLLAQAHVTRFNRLLDLADTGQRGIRVDECEHYKAIWVSVRDKACTADFSVAQLTEAEKSEIRDAVDSGDYDHLFTN